jgi:hypothetical protein
MMVAAINDTLKPDHSFRVAFKGRHDIQPNDTQPNATTHLCHSSVACTIKILQS